MKIVIFIISLFVIYEYLVFTFQIDGKCSLSLTLNSLKNYPNGRSKEKSTTFA